MPSLFFNFFRFLILPDASFSRRAITAYLNLFNSILLRWLDCLPQSSHSGSSSDFTHISGQSHIQFL